jgi:hypothetical protein
MIVGKLERSRPTGRLFVFAQDADRPYRGIA